MTVEREFAGFAISFAAGILTASLWDCIPYHAVCAASLPLIALEAIWIYVKSGRRQLFSLALPSIMLLAFTTGIFCFCNEAALSLSRPSDPTGIERLAQSFCRNIQELIDSLPFRKPETAALTKALLTGEKSDIPEELAQTFRASGAAHILALSGLHLGIIYSIVLKTLKCIGNQPKTRIIKSILTIAACGFYTLAVGAGESITRAFLFILLNELARLGGRSRKIKHVLLSCLVIQLAISPSSIRTVGFQLSYAAMAGIAYIHPWLKSFWPSEGIKMSLPEKIWDSVSLSIACQLMTGPLAWFYFKTFPKHFILTNLISLPLTGLIIPLSLLTLVLYKTGLCPNMLIVLTESLIEALSYSLRIISGM